MTTDEVPVEVAWNQAATRLMDGGFTYGEAADLLAAFISIPDGIRFRAEHYVEWRDAGFTPSTVARLEDDRKAGIDHTTALATLAALHGRRR